MSLEENNVSNPDAASAEEPQLAAEEEVDAVQETTELDKYWKAVNDNPQDFTGWTYLLQYVEQEKPLEDARVAFEAFLGRYPYCYGYWKKYADLEKKNENLDKAEEVFEKGLASIPLSIDLWIQYLTFGQEKYEDDPEKETKTRKLYERSIEAAGMDFKSDKLWDMYLYWEQTNKNLKNITNLYDRILNIPTQLYSHQFESFSEHVNQNNPREILSLDEFLKIRQDVVKKSAEEKKDNDEVVDSADGPPGAEPELPPPGEEAAPPGEDNPPGTGSLGPEDESEITAIREKVIDNRQTVHKLNVQEVSKRWNFEEAIRRPYFHVKPLEKSQLKNWREYLDFEIENGTHERVVILFERCLIACALYEELWMKYAKYMEAHSTDAVREIYKRACTIYLQQKPTIHLAWAAFEELKENFEAAEEILTNFEKIVPNLAMVCLRKISLHRRQGHFEKVSEMYKQCMVANDGSPNKSFYAMKLARYHAKVLSNVPAARDVLEEALNNDEDNPKLYLQLLDLEYQQTSVDELRVNGLFRKALSSNLSLENKLTFSQRQLEFLEDLSPSITRVQDAYENHQKLLKEMTSQTTKKRKAAQETIEETPTEKKAKTVTNGTGDVSLATTTPPATQSSADYNMQQQNYYNQSAWNTGYNNMAYNYSPWASYNSQYYPS